MNSEEWKSRIVEACELSGTYNVAFDAVISTLADVMALRDSAMRELMESNEPSVITKTSDRGAKNLAQNPRLKVVMELNQTALTFWKELLLKPLARKNVAVSHGRTLDDVLKEMEEENDA